MSSEPKNIQKSLESEEHSVRCQKVEALRKEGVEPWPATHEVTETCQQVHDEFDLCAESKVYQLAGRIMSKREHGKTMFLVIQDRTTRLQLYIRKDEVGEESFGMLMHQIDVGDIIWVSGVSFRTKMGEITLKVSSYTLLSKCLHPLPEKFHGIADIEIKYRQRYLDLITSAESRERFVKRTKIVRAMRDFFDEHDFIEVETPMLHPIPGGAAARPFVTHHNALDMCLFMRIAPELYLKRLVVGGLERVFEINRNFRNEGVSTRHNPEFTMAEWYIAYKEYHWGMDFLEALLKRVVQEVCGTLEVMFGERSLNFSSFTRMSMVQAVQQYAHCTAEDLSPLRINDVLKHHALLDENEHLAWGNKLVLLFEKLVEPHLIQPTFITEFPVEVSPLAKRNRENPAVTDRFELFIAGMELSNGFNELNDPMDQAARFKEQANARTCGDDEAHHYDEEYIIALEYGLPPTFGCGMGIDRLAMLLTNTTSIKDVILFPTLKKK